MRVTAGVCNVFPERMGLLVYLPDNPHELLEQVDQAFCSAKSDGRNRVGVWRCLSTPANTSL
jgi:hypothetical protein